MIRNKSGITLVALIITIVILLILAVVAIRSIQNDGIISYAEKSVILTELSSIKEQIDLKNIEDAINENEEETEITLESLNINSKYSEYLCIKDNELYVKSNATEEIKEAAIKLGIMILHEVPTGQSNTNITVAKKTVINNYQIYGNTTQNGTPTPQAPISIQSLGEDGNLKIRITGKNLFYFTAEDFKNGIEGGEGKDVYITLLPNTQYTLSSNAPMKDTYATNIWFNGGNAGVNGVSNGISRTTITDAEGKLYISIRTENIDMIFNNYWIQLEEGSKATTYEPYRESITIDMEEYEPLRKVGDVADYIDFKTGKVVRKVGKKVFTGTEAISLERPLDNKYGCIYPYALTQHKVQSWSIVANLICTHFKPISYNRYYNDGEIGIAVYGNNGYGLCMRVGSEIATDATLFKTWLSFQNIMGMPVEVYYELETPIYEDINLPEIELEEGINNILIEGTSKVYIEF